MGKDAEKSGRTGAGTETPWGAPVLAGVKDLPSGSGPKPIDPRRTVLVFLVLPFLVLSWLCPFLSRIGIGNDYPIYSIGAQQELLFSLRHGTFPLFFPTAGDGISAAGLTLGQLYHPITWIVGLLPGYWSGQALEWNTLLRLLELGLTHYVVFRFLLGLRLHPLFAFLFSFIAVYNMSMLDLLRYGASLENYCGFLLLMAAIGWHFLRPVPVWSFCRMVLAAYLLLAGGHPQYMYFGMLGAAVMIPILPHYLPLMAGPRPAAQARQIRFCLEGYGALAAAVLLSAAWWMPFYFDYMAGDTIRVKMPYAWATINQDSLYGVLSSFFNPLFGDVHGNFGGSALLLAAAVLPLLIMMRVRIPRVIGVIWLLLATVLFYELGSATPVHYLFWRYAPFFSSFRVPGRLAMINPFLCMLLLAWIAGQRPMRLRVFSRIYEAPPVGPLMALAALIFLAWQLTPHDWFKAPASYAPVSLPHASQFGNLNQIPTGWHALVIGSGLASLLCCATFGLFRRRPWWLAWALSLAVIAQTAFVLRHGTWKTMKTKTPSLQQMTLARRDTPGSTAEFVLVNEHSRTMQKFLDYGGERDPRPAALYPRAIAAGSLLDAMLYQDGGLEETEVAVEGLKDFPSEPRAPKGSVNTVRTIFASFNRFEFTVNCQRPSIFTLGFPYLPGRWRASVDGIPVTILRANGVYPAIVAPAGKSTVEFRYVSMAQLTGLAITFMAAWLLSFAMAARIGGFALRWLVRMAALCFGAVFFLFIWHGFYGGQGVGTVYAEEFPARYEVPEMTPAESSSAEACPEK